MTTIDTGRKVTICNTDWPVTVQISKWRSKWTAAEVCNGIASAHATFSSKRAALAWAATR